MKKLRAASWQGMAGRTAHGHSMWIAIVTGAMLAFADPASLHAATKKNRPPADSSDEAAPESPNAGSEAPSGSKYGPDATVEPEKIAEFSSQPARVQQLIRDAIDLTRQNLTYTFGSADPTKGGMDCSGTIYYLLQAHDLKDVPRDSSGQYLWARKACAFYPVVSKNAESVEFEQLEPGDLMFWTGTYQSGRDVPISHVMLYLGREKGTGKRIMFGASDGRSYNGVQRWGVSVFDFKMPKNDPNNTEKRRVDFVGYARIPGLRDTQDSSPSSAVASEENNPPAKNAIAKDADESAPAPKKKSTVAKDADESTPAPKKKSAVKKSTPRKRVENSDNQ